MTTFGNYELIAPLGSGGMSNVWLARSPGADGIVVLKRLLRAHLGEPEIVAMFQDEADLGELLRHPNLVRTFEHGTAEGEPYIVMERLEGEDVRTVRRTIRRKRQVVPFEIAVEILIRACDGLHAAHELCGPGGKPLQIVHRDVSPHNIIVTFEGDVKVLDFGIAKSARQRIETKHGVLKGKIPYMAPEQIRAEKVDRRTDVYALGVVLYELAVGERPYYMTAPSEFALMMAIVHGDLRFPSTIRRDFPSELEAIVMRALSGSPERRHPTAAALAKELIAFRDREKLPSGRDMLARWMGANFAERIDSLRRAASPVELAEQLAFAEKRRREAENEDDDVETARRAKPAAEERSSGAQHSLSRRPLATAVLATLSGRINESFDGNEIGRTIAESKRVVLDLAGVERVTSYGVREWIAMMGACKQTELWLARCAEPIVAQLSMIPGFAGHARVASLVLSYRCSQCDASSVRLVDLETDAAELLAGAPAPGTCEHCGGETRAEDDEASLRFTKPWLGKPIEASVRAALAVIAREGDGAPPPVEKIVLGTETHVRLRRGVGRRMRFRRVLDGIEGHLRVDVRDPAALDAKGAQELARALLDLGPEVTSIAVQGAPAALSAALGGSKRVEILSRQTEKATTLAPPAPDAAPTSDKSVPSSRRAARSGKRSTPPNGTDPRAAPAPADAAPPRDGAPAGKAHDGAAAGETSQVRAGTSAGDVVLHPPKKQPNGDRADAPGSDAKKAVSRAAAPAPTGGRTALFVGAAIALVAVVGWLRLRRSDSSDPAPSASIGATVGSGSVAGQANATNSSGALENAPSEGIEKIDGAREITAIGRGPTDDAALASARARAVVLLVDAVRAALPEDVRAVEEAAAPFPTADEIARRFLAHLGVGATPERKGARPVSASGDRALAAQFRVSDAAFAQAVAYFGEAKPFRGASVVPALPTVGDAGWIVVRAAPNGPLHEGDRVIAVGPRDLSPSELPNNVTSPEPELRVVRGREAVVVRSP
ncbi:MAG: serine/threonine-protein kinase [Polyangiaceae bacterium]